MKVLGIDEVGRGALSSEILACGVYMEDDGTKGIYKDSKQYTPQKRELMKKKIDCEILDCHYEFLGNDYIDTYGVGNANLTIVKNILRYFMDYPLNIIHIDWIHHLKNDELIKKLERKGIKVIIEPKADIHYKSVAYASILAKLKRDEFLIALHENYPQYHWNKNKGYATKEHIDAILHCGISPYHRITYLKNYNIPKFGDD